MNKDLIVSSTPQETKVALLEDGAVAEFFIEREATGAPSATSIRAGSPGSCPACSPPSWTSALMATPSCTSVTFSRTLKITITVMATNRRPPFLRAKSLQVQNISSFQENHSAALTKRLLRNP